MIIKRMYLIAILILFYSNCYSQKVEPWTVTKGPYPNNNIRTCSFSSIGQFLFVGTSISEIYKTIRFGSTWTKVSNGIPPALGIQSLYTINNEKLFAGTYDKGLFYSNNLGVTWIKVNDVPNGYSVNSIYEYKEKLFLGTQNGIFVSKNKGINWIKVGNYSTTSFCSTDSLLFIGSSSSGNIFKSADNGKTWVISNNGLPKNTTINSLIVDGSLIIAGLNAKNGFKEINESSIFLSKDNGLNWIMVDDLPSNLTINCFYKDNHKHRDLLLAGTDQGVFYSSNNGKNWRKSNDGLPDNLKVLTFHSVVTHVGEIIYLGGTNGKVYFKYVDDKF